MVLLFLSQHPPDLTIGADTVVTMDNKIFEKPRDKEDAFQMLSRLVSGLVGISI